MKMKDKIYKNNHKKVYYYFKKTGLSVGIFLGAFIFLAIPVSILKSIVSTDVNMVKTHIEEKGNLKTFDSSELLNF